MKWLKTFIVWLVIISAESVHGAARIRWLVPVVGDHQARQICVFTGSVLIVSLTWLFIRWMQLPTTRSLLAGGFGWLVLTLAFEVVLGNLVFNQSWETIWSDYDLSQGGLMSFGAIVLVLAPLIATKLRRLQPAPSPLR